MLHYTLLFARGLLKTDVLSLFFKRWLFNLGYIPFHRWYDSVNDRVLFLRQFASLMVQAALRERRVADAVGLYRTARALWPFEEIFGSDKMQPEEEFIAMRVIYFSDLTQVTKFSMCINRTTLLLAHSN